MTIRQRLGKIMARLHDLEVDLWVALYEDEPRETIRDIKDEINDLRREREAIYSRLNSRFGQYEDEGRREL